MVHVNFGIVASFLHLLLSLVLSHELESLLPALSATIVKDDGDLLHGTVLCFGVHKVRKYQVDGQDTNVDEVAASQREPTTTNE